MNGIKKVLTFVVISIFMLSAVKAFANSTTTCSYSNIKYVSMQSDFTVFYADVTQFGGTPVGSARPLDSMFASSTCVTITDPTPSLGGTDYTPLLRAIASSTEAQAFTFDHTIIYNGLLILSVYFFGFIYYFKRRTQL